MSDNTKKKSNNNCEANIKVVIKNILKNNKNEEDVT